MQPKTPKLLDDLRDAAAFISEAVRDKTLDDYHGDRILQQAIERNFEIIGEAMKRLGRHDADSVARIGDYWQIIARLSQHPYSRLRPRRSPARLEHDPATGSRTAKGCSRPARVGRLSPGTPALAGNRMPKHHYKTEDFEVPPFNQRGGLGKVHQLFGSELPMVIEELNRELAA